MLEEQSKYYPLSKPLYIAKLISVAAVALTGLYFGLLRPLGNRDRGIYEKKVYEQMYPDTVFEENVFREYDAQLVRYESYTTLNIGIFDGEKRFYSGDHDIILATDLNNDKIIDVFPYYPKGWRFGITDGELEPLVDRNTLSGLEKRMLHRIH
jgi:hypothetical protein